MLEITAAMSGLKGTLDLLDVAVKARDDRKVTAAISDPTSRFIDAQNSVIALQERVHALQAQVAEANAQLTKLDQREAERKNYVLHEIARGRWVYRFQPVGESSVSQAAAPHYLCQNCFDKGIRSVLRLNRGSEWLNDSLLCAEGGGGHHIQLDTRS